MKIVATNVIASRPPERRPTATPTACAKNVGQEEDQLRNQNISEKLQKIAKFLKSSKYVIIVITTFTICWMPWILNVFYDIMLHELGILQDSIDHNCGILTYRNNHFDVFSLEDFDGQSCVHAITS